MTDKQIEFLDLQLGMMKLAETMPIEEMEKDERAEDYMERLNTLTVEMGFECFQDLHKLGYAVVAFIDGVVAMSEALVTNSEV